MAVCASKLNQIFDAVFIYSIDNDDRLPFMAGINHRGNVTEWWPTQIAQAMDQFNPDMYVCPGDANPGKLPTPFYYYGSSITLKVNPSNRSIYLPITYRGACDLVEDVIVNGKPSGQYAPRKITSWQRSAEALLLVEGRPERPSPFGQTTTSVPRSCFKFTSELGLMADPAYRHPFHETWQRHLGKGNYLFVDGHVDTLLTREAGQLANNQEHYLTSHP